MSLKRQLIFKFWNLNFLSQIHIQLFQPQPYFLSNLNEKQLLLRISRKNPNFVPSLAFVKSKKNWSHAIHTIKFHIFLTLNKIYYNTVQFLNYYKINFFKFKNQLTNSPVLDSEFNLKKKSSSESKVFS